MTVQVFNDAAKNVKARMKLAERRRRAVKAVPQALPYGTQTNVFPQTADDVYRQNPTDEMPQLRMTDRDRLRVLAPDLYKDVLDADETSSVVKPLYEKHRWLGKKILRRKLDERA